MNENRFQNSTKSTVTVTTSTTEIVPGNSARQYCAISNGSANDVWISLGSPAVVGEGILLKADGGTYEINNENLFPGAINGIAGSNSAVGVQESNTR